MSSYGFLTWAGIVYAGSITGVTESAPVSGCIGNLTYSGTVYEGFVCKVAASGVIPSVPSNVLNLDDSIGRLGCGVPSFFITRRCTGSGVECVLDDYVSSATWTRVLDDVSEAEVTCSFSGTSDFTCCECLAETEPWCSELHIWRDGEEVWVGPIQEITYSYNQVTVKAKDSLAWMGVRILPGNVDYTTSGLGAADLSDIAQDIINIAFAEDTVTCEVDNVYKVASGEVSQRFFEAYTDTDLNILLDLADTGLNVTTLGRTIVLAGDDTPLTPLVILNDEHIMGNITVTKNGDVQGNRFFVHFDGDGGIPASGEAANFYCYGPIERIREGNGVVEGVSAAAVADAYVAASAIAPRILEVPSGSKLSPDTPWTINQMVCGARVDVAVTKLCLNLTQSFILTGVEVSYNSGEEAVTISLTPINDVQVA